MNRMFGKAGTVILRGESRHLHSLVNKSVHNFWRKIGRVGCSRPLADENTQHELSRNSLLYRLYFTHAYCDREAVVFANEDIGRSRSVLPCPVYYMFCSAPQIRHLLFRSTYSDLSNLDRGQANTYGNSLAVLPADADTLIQLEIAPHCRHLTQNGWAITNQCRPFHRRRHVTIFNEISLAGGKHEFAARNIDLTAAELNGI